MKKLLIFGAVGFLTASSTCFASDAPQPPTGWAAKAGLTTLLPARAPILDSEIAARLAIQDLFARYATALDDGNAEVMQSLFTDDAPSSIQLWDGTSLAAVIGGRQIAQQFQHLLAVQKDQRRHLIANIVVQNVTADAANAIAAGVVTRSADDITTLAGSVVYSAGFRRSSDGLWRFSRLTIGGDTSAGARSKQH